MKETHDIDTQLILYIPPKKVPYWSGWCFQDSWPIPISYV